MARGIARQGLFQKLPFGTSFGCNLCDRTQFGRAITLACLFISIFSFGTIHPVYGQRLREVDAEQVNKAIDSVVRYLLSSQNADGGWGEVPRYPKGVSCLVTLSLLNAGLPPERPEMQRALNYITQHPLGMTYSVSLQTMAMCESNPNAYAAKIARNAKWLIEAQRDDGGWDYDIKKQQSDPSNSQYALLALHEAQRSGVAFPKDSWIKVFSRAENYWRTIQNQDGSFPYRGAGSLGSMTCAGIASLIITGAQLDDLEASTNGQTISCCGKNRGTQDAIEKALNWMARNFKTSRNPGTQNNYQMYYLYALERAGRLSGRRFLGDHDWYREGAETIIHTLMPGMNGAIDGRGGGGNRYSETAFGLLFLAKGKRQLLVNRLKYRSDRRDDWNHHSTAIRNITAHTEQVWKRSLTWQTVDLEVASLQDLLQAPVLFISGSSVPMLSDRQKRLLKDYVEQNGFIFVEGCDGDGCNGKRFETYFSKLALEIFDSPLEKLPPDHPIWYAEAPVKPEDLPEGAWLYGVESCCRLGVVYCPYSLSCRWELNLPYGAKRDFGDKVQGDLDTATKIGVNVMSYATGKELKEKLETVTILEEVANTAPTDRGVFILPILRHNAGYDDASRSVPNLIQWLGSSNPFQMSSEKRIISVLEEDLENYPVVFIHGRGELRFSDTQRKVLREYLKRGNMLFGDAICADEQFANSFRREMQLITGEALEPLAEGHSMLTDEFYGFDVRQVEIIDVDKSGDNIVSAKRKIAPRLEVAKMGGRITVVFSPLDMSCALESQHSLQCKGYTREDAARLGMNILLFSLMQ